MDKREVGGVERFCLQIAASTAGRKVWHVIVRTLMELCRALRPRSMPSPFVTKGVFVTTAIGWKLSCGSAAFCILGGLIGSIVANS